jgi:hypothetical protein
MSWSGSWPGVLPRDKQLHACPAAFFCFLALIPTAAFAHSSSSLEAEQLNREEFRRIIVEYPAPHTQACEDSDQEAARLNRNELARIEAGNPNAPVSRHGIECPLRKRKKPTHKKTANKAAGSIKAIMGISIRDIEKYGILGGPNSFIRKSFGLGGDELPDIINPAIEATQPFNTGRPK